MTERKELVLPVKSHEIKIVDSLRNEILGYSISEYVTTEDFEAATTEEKEANSIPTKNPLTKKLLYNILYGTHKEITDMLVGTDGSNGNPVTPAELATITAIDLAQDGELGDYLQDRINYLLAHPDPKIRMTLSGVIADPKFTYLGVLSHFLDGKMPPPGFDEIALPTLGEEGQTIPKGATGSPSEVPYKLEENARDSIKARRELTDFEQACLAANETRTINEVDWSNVPDTDLTNRLFDDKHPSAQGKTPREMYISVLGGEVGLALGEAARVARCLGVQTDPSRTEKQEAGLALEHTLGLFSTPRVAEQEGQQRQ